MILGAELGSELNALIWSERIISVAVFLQTLELFALKPALAEDGIWRWSLVREQFTHFPRPAQALLNQLLGERGFQWVLALRLFCAVCFLIFPSYYFVIPMILSTILISLRWGGTFNGGSDFMTLIVLTGVCFSSLFKNSHSLRLAGLWYLAIQACTSYFVAGWTKLKTRNWRNGKALTGFMSTTLYGPAPGIMSWSQISVIPILLSWGVILFEFGFPLALLNRQVCVMFIGAALVFHLANAYIFGLNRFLFAWAATYPALYYCSSILFK